MNTLAAALQPFVDKNYIAGAVVLAATKDRVLECAAVGYADLAAKKPMTPDTLVWIASQTKPITATAFMMLVDEGKVSIDDPVEKYLPEFRNQKVIAYQDDDVTVLKKPQHPITVREILNHTAGLAFSSPIESPTLDRHALRDSVRSHAMLPLQFEPGTQYLYSNGGTNTAGRIIEVVSGEAYEDFMDQRLFHPLGMRDTTFWPSQEQLARTAKCYASNLEKTALIESRITQLAYPLSDHYRKPMPAGGLFSTAADCATFLQMILNGGVAGGRRYISEASISAMTRKQTAEGVPNEYGLGWGVENGKYGHGGACKTGMEVNPKLGLITVFLVQHNGELPNEEAGTIRAVFNAAAEKLLG
ncbi:MAG TPA: serine hydrolase domain-containing protein [Candidatus Methylacidiphilales bacterium]|nr:serine hydrolase domain-containing protein [Candidatus Methylacidiphilales bacterium]